MPLGDGQSRTEALQSELAEVIERIEELSRERKLFGRLGFSDEHMKLELRQLEKRRERCERALKALRPATSPDPVARPRRVEI